MATTGWSSPTRFCRRPSSNSTLAAPSADSSAGGLRKGQPVSTARIDADVDFVLDQVEALDREATPGPWTNGNGRQDLLYEGVDGILCPCDGAEPPVRVLLRFNANFPCAKDARLAARYRTLAPALAEEVRRLRGEVVAWRKLVETEELLDGVEERRKERRKKLGLEP